MCLKCLKLVQKKTAISIIKCYVFCIITYICKTEEKIYKSRNDVNIYENAQMQNVNLEIKRNINLTTAKGMRDVITQLLNMNKLIVVDIFGGNLEHIVFIIN